MRLAYLLAVPALLAASAPQAALAWHRFVSPTGFSVEYPLAWSDPRLDRTPHAKPLIWRTSECPEFALNYIKPDDDHAGAPYYPGQFSIGELEMEHTISVQDEKNFITKNEDKISKIYNTELNHSSTDRCGNVTVIESSGPIGPFGQPGANRPWLQNKTDIICAIGKRKFRFSLYYANNDARADEFSRLLIEMTRSFRLIPVKHKGPYCTLAGI